MKVNTFYNLLTTKYTAYFVIFLVNLLGQSQNLFNELETSSSLYTYLYIGQDLLNGNLPYENQWEMKGPVLPVIYSFIVLLTSGNILNLKIFTLLLIYLMSLIIFNYNLKISSSYLLAYTSSLFFSLFLMSYSFGFSTYYEYFLCLLIYLLIDKIEYFTKKPYILGIIFALGSLYFQFFVAFGIPLLIKIHRINKLRKTYFFRGILGFTSIHLISYLFFLVNDLSEIYLFTIFKFPLLYQENIQYDVGVLTFFYYLKDNENIFLLISMISLIIFYFDQIRKKVIFQILNKIPEIIFLSLGYFLPIFTNKLSGNHWIYFIFFSALFMGSFYKKNNRISVTILLIILVVGILGQLLPGYQNLKHFDEISYKSEDLANKLTDENLKIKTSFVMNINNLQTSLNLENVSYITHPTLRDKSQIGQLEKVIKMNQSFNSIIKKNPDLIVCNIKKDFCNALISNNNYFLYDEIIIDKTNLNVFLNKKFNQG